MRLNTGIAPTSSLRAGSSVEGLGNYGRACSQANRPAASGISAILKLRGLVNWELVESCLSRLS